MSTKPLKQPLPGEHILRVEPRPAPFVEAGWLSRPHLYTGRALGAEVLATEQRGRSGRLALSGQRVSPGVVEGLEVRLEREQVGGQEHWYFHFSPGRGLAASGEDVVVPRLMRISTCKVLAWKPEATPFNLQALSTLKPQDTQAGLSVAVLVLVPVVVRREDEASSSNPSEVDPDTEALEDPQLVDGCVPVLCAWPEHWSRPQVDAQWRNKLVHMLFDYERQRNPEDLAPWEEVGVPVALVGFDPSVLVDGTPKPVFVDRTSVVRCGCTPRKRSALAPLSGTPLLWQARLQQFSEHLADLGPQAVAAGTAMQAFSRLPPVGVLPPQAVDFRHWTQRFFPSRFIIEAMPVPLEQLDAVAQASAALAPLRAAEPERVRLLVPVPQEHFEPRLLQSEFLDAAFPRAVDSGLHRLGEWRRRQEDLRDKSNVLMDAMEGRTTTPRFPSPDPAAIAAEHVGVAPADPATYGPEEGAYGTQGERIPVLDETLARWGSQGSWSAITTMSLRETAGVTVASDPQNRTLMAVVDGPTPFIMLRENSIWMPLDTPEALHKPFTAIWSDGNFLLLSLVRTPQTSSQAHLRIWQYTSQGWREPVDSSPVTSSPSSPPVLAAATWREGHIDIFTIFQTDSHNYNLVKWTWNQGITNFQDFGTIEFSTATIKDLLAIHRGEQRIDILYETSQFHTVGNHSLRHLGGIHEGTNPSLSLSSPTTVSSSLSGDITDRNIRACTSMPGRLDIFFKTDKRIFHLWHERTWRETTIASNNDNVYALEAISPRHGRIDVLWCTKSNQNSQESKLMHYTYELGWQPVRTITTELNLATARNSLRAVRSVTGIIDVLLALGTRGLGHLSKAADDAISLIVTSGVQGVISHGEQVARRLDDFVQTNLLRVQSEMQRVRQLMISGSAETSRLAASPVLTRAISSVNSPLTSLLDANTWRQRQQELNSIGRSDALEAMQDAANSKRGVLTQLTLLVRETGLDVTGLLVPGVALVTTINGEMHVVLALSGSISTKRITRQDEPLASLVASNAQLESVLSRIEEEPDALGRALAAANLTYTGFDYFSTAVQILEQTLTLLRSVERLLKAQLETADAFRNMLNRLKSFKSELDKRLKVVDGEVAESRQDVTVARALMAEELARVGAINERRQQVLEEHVRLLVFQRPREKGLDLEAPVRVLDSAIVQDVLPEVLASTEAAPPELWSFVELLKDAPLKWLTAGPVLLGRLDRLELLRRALERARERAGIRTPPILPVRPVAPSPKVQLGLSRLYLSLQEVVARRRGLAASVELPVLRQRSWRELQREALELLTPGDLMDIASGRSDVGREASEELERLSKVATGLYQRFGEVSPVLRLEWVENFSQYDVAVDLHDLAHLPRWDQVQPQERREMQRLVDWLFSRVSTSEPEAVSLVNDLVRACLLLASHAPVDELVGAHVSKAAVARVGELVELALDPSRVRIGMHVMLSSGGHMVQAVVEDLSTGTAQARVFSTTAPVVHLPEKTVATLSDPGRGKGMLLPSLGTKR